MNIGMVIGGGALVGTALLLAMSKRKPANPLRQTEYYTEAPAASVGWYWTPRVTGPGDYPLDTDFGERFVRPRRGRDFFPYPGRQITAELEWKFMGAADYTLPQGNVAMVELGSIKRATVGPYPNFDDIYVASFQDIATPTERKTG